MTRLRIFCLLLVALYASSVSASDIPKGWEFVFKNISKGKPYHPLWPPISGQDILGTIVIAHNPRNIEAAFESIDSPVYRNPTYTSPFTTGARNYPGAKLGSSPNISGNIGFSQLDDLSGALKGGAKADSFEGKANSSQKSTDDQRNVTGIDFSKVDSVTVDVSNIKETFYSYDTITKVFPDTSTSGGLNSDARRALEKSTNGWIVSMCITADSFTYTLTSNSGFDAGFFAKLLAWLPTASIKYKNKTTVTITSTSPAVIGYKLWRPGIGPQSTSAKASSKNVADYSISDQEIDSVLQNVSH
jgi:hypothetical protein